MSPSSSLLSSLAFAALGLLAPSFAQALDLSRALSIPALDQMSQEGEIPSAPDMASLSRKVRFSVPEAVIERTLALHGLPPIEREDRGARKTLAALGVGELWFSREPLEAARGDRRWVAPMAVEEAISRLAETPESGGSTLLAAQYTYLDSEGFTESEEIVRLARIPARRLVVEDMPWTIQVGPSDIVSLKSWSALENVDTARSILDQCRSDMRLLHSSTMRFICHEIEQGSLQELSEEKRIERLARHSEFCMTVRNRQGELRSFLFVRKAMSSQCRPSLSRGTLCHGLNGSVQDWLFDPTEALNELSGPASGRDLGRARFTGILRPLFAGACDRVLLPSEAGSSFSTVRFEKH